MNGLLEMLVFFGAALVLGIVELLLMRRQRRSNHAASDKRGKINSK